MLSCLRWVFHRFDDAGCIAMESDKYSHFLYIQEGEMRYKSACFFPQKKIRQILSRNACWHNVMANNLNLNCSLRVPVPISLLHLRRPEAIVSSKLQQIFQVCSTDWRTYTIVTTVTWGFFWVTTRNINWPLFVVRLQPKNKTLRKYSEDTIIRFHITNWTGDCLIRRRYRQMDWEKKE